MIVFIKEMEYIVMSDSEKTLFDKYKTEVAIDTTYDRLSLEDVQLRLPAIKAKWVARLHNHKQELTSIYDELDTARNTVLETVKNDSPVGLTDAIALKMGEKTEAIRKIKKIVRQTENLIEYLENVVKLISNMTYDLKNSIEIIKLEQS